MNKIYLIGNLTKEPEVRYTPSGKAICRIRGCIHKEKS